jgi:hypothetical protein
VTAACLELQRVWGNPIRFETRHQRGHALDPVIYTQSFFCFKALNFSFSPFVLQFRVGVTILTMTSAAFTARTSQSGLPDLSWRTPTSRHFAFTESVALVGVSTFPTLDAPLGFMN